MHQEDPGRLSTYAQCCTSDTGGLPAHTDVVGYNTYYGWYDAFGTADQFGAWADNLHAAKPTWKIGISEYGAGAGITQHADNPTRPDPYGTPHPEEWQNLVHESHWKQMKTRRYLWAKIDLEHVRLRRRQPQRGRHARAQRQGPGHLRSQDAKGRVLLVQGELDDGAVRLHHVTPVHPRTTATATVKVYSNMESVRLQVNGTSDRRRPPAPIASSSGRTSRSRTGANTIVATGTSGTMTATDTVTWTRK